MKSSSRNSMTLTLAALGVMVVIGGILWFAMHRGSVSSSTKNSTAGKIKASVVGPTGASEPTISAVNVNAPVDGSNLELFGAYRSADYALAHASNGNEFIVVEFRQLPGNAIALTSAVTDATLRAGSKSYHPVAVNLPSLVDTQSHGSLVFEIPKGETSLSLSVGSKSVIPLNIPAS